jgi:lipid-A-disaccharide synthase
MEKEKKIFIIAGEDSSDILAGGLMTYLNKKIKCKYYGVGGVQIKNAGLKKSLFPISDIAIMGFDILFHLPKLINRINITVEEILKVNPDIVVSVDSPDFCFRVLKKVHKKNKNIKLVHYVSPTVWAWREKRAVKISKFLTGILLLFPFEKKYYPNIKSFYVGHRAYKEIKTVKKINSNTILCLPGSRKKEVEVLMPIFVKAINNLYKKDNSIKVKIPVANDYIKPIIENEIVRLCPKAELLETEKEKKQANGKIAICASGTACLELALKEIPTIIAYKMGGFSAIVVKFLVKTKWVGLPSIIMGGLVSPEFLQKNCTANNIEKEMAKLLYNENLQEKQKALFKKLKTNLKVKNLNPDELAAQAIIKML